MENYKIHKVVGDGSFGIVYKATSIKTGEIVAIKKIKKKFYSWDECMSLRELKSLRKLNHPNIIKLKEAIKVNDELHFVFEYLDQNLFQMYNQMRDNGKTFTENQIRSIIYQAALALAYMHKHGFFHRDLKPENLLVHKEYVKVADFGLAREIRSRPPFTDYVATRWYRAPEILLKSTNYNSPVDIFALGCIMAELYTLSPLFRGTSEMDQIYKVCSILGAPTQTGWSEGYKLAAQMGFNFPQYPAVPLNSIIPNACDDAIQLISEMIKYDPNKRPSAQQVLQHPYFANYVHIERLMTPQMSEGSPVLQLRELKEKESPIKTNQKTLEFGKKSNSLFEIGNQVNDTSVGNFHGSFLDSFLSKENKEKNAGDFLSINKNEKKGGKIAESGYKGILASSIIEEDLKESDEKNDESINTQLLEEQINQVMEEYKPELSLKESNMKKNKSNNPNQSPLKGSSKDSIDLVLPPQNKSIFSVPTGPGKIQAGHGKFLNNMQDNGYNPRRERSPGKIISERNLGSLGQSPYDFSVKHNNLNNNANNSNSSLYLPKNLNQNNFTLPTYEGHHTNTSQNLPLYTNTGSTSNLYNFSTNRGYQLPNISGGLSNRSPQMTNKYSSLNNSIMKNSNSNNYNTSHRMSDAGAPLGGGFNFESVFQEEVGGLGRYKF